MIATSVFLVPDTGAHTFEHARRLMRRNPLAGAAIELPWRRRDRAHRFADLGQQIICTAGAEGAEEAHRGSHREMVEYAASQFE